MNITSDIKEALKDMYLFKFNQKNEADFEADFESYVNLKEFKINENVFSANPYFNNSIHYIMRCYTTIKITEAFQAMKIDLSDPNVTVDYDTGNIGTPGRVAKLWTGKDIHDDDELLCGRWTEPPRYASFPNKVPNKIPITKKIDLIGVCSHHIAPFSSTFREDGVAIVSYIPNNLSVGISKLQRIVDWVAKRGWLQEDLTKAIFDEVSKAADTPSVYVGLLNIEHSCESIRGANSKNGSFTTEYYEGDFMDVDVRESMKRSVL